MTVTCCDRILVLRAQCGEHGAFNALVHRYRRRVMNITMRYIRDRADAEDAVQNTFLKAFRGLKHFRGDASFYTWLHRIAVNSAMTARSRRAREIPSGINCALSLTAASNTLSRTLRCPTISKST